MTVEVALNYQQQIPGISEPYRDEPDEPRAEAAVARVSGFLRTAGMVIILVVAGAGTAVLWHAFREQPVAEQSGPAAAPQAHAGSGQPAQDPVDALSRDPRALASAVVQLQAGQQKIAEALAALQNENQSIQKAATLQQAELKQVVDSVASLGGQIDTLQKSMAGSRSPHPVPEASRKPARSSTSRPVATSSPPSEPNRP